MFPSMPSADYIDFNNHKLQDATCKVTITIEFYL